MDRHVALEARPDTAGRIWSFHSLGRARVPGGVPCGMEVQIMANWGWYFSTFNMLVFDFANRNGEICQTECYCRRWWESAWDTLPKTTQGVQWPAQYITTQTNHSRRVLRLQSVMVMSLRIASGYFVTARLPLFWPSFFWSFDVIFKGHSWFSFVEKDGGPL